MFAARGETNIAFVDLSEVHCKNSIYVYNIFGFRSSLQKMHTSITLLQFNVKTTFLLLHLWSWGQKQAITLTVSRVANVLLGQLQKHYFYCTSNFWA